MERCWDEGDGAAGVPCSSPGTSPPADANDRHVDLVQLTARAVAGLARAMHREAEFARRPPKAVRSLAETAFERSRIDVDRLSPRVRERLLPGQ